MSMYIFFSNLNVNSFFPILNVFWFPCSLYPYEPYNLETTMWVIITALGATVIAIIQCIISLNWQNVFKRPFQCPPWHLRSSYDRGRACVTFTCKFANSYLVLSYEHIDKTVGRTQNLHLHRSYEVWLNGPLLIINARFLIV